VKARTHFNTLLAALTLAIFTLTLPSADAQTGSVIYSFTGRTDGWGPAGGLVSDAAGNLYGTTVVGGEPGGCEGAGCGVVYKLSPTAAGWVQTVIYTFTGGADGAEPWSGLVRDAKGDLYGVAGEHGNSGCLLNYGCGLVFELSPSGSGWQETVLYAFSGGDDGSAPLNRLVMDHAGNLYGTTSEGGDLLNCPSHSLGCGGAFKLNRTQTGWTFTLLYDFTDSDSAEATSALVLDAAGNLYGAGDAGPYGVIYELSPGSDGAWTDTLLHRFSNLAKGSGPTGLVFDAKGNLYGPTYSGGTGGDVYDCEDVRPGCGTLFKLSHGSGGWAETVLHNFTGNDPSPNGNLIFGPAGKLYGVDSSEVFMLFRDSNGVWTMTVPQTLTDTFPKGPLFIDKAGNLFGATEGGGSDGYGSVFETTP